MNSPSTPQPGFYNAAVQAGDFSPRTYALCLPGVSQEAVISPVSLLREHGHPLDIAGLIMPFNINSLKRVSGRAWPYVGEEACEVVQPLVAHHNTASTISVPSDIARSGASNLSAIPRHILTRESVAARVTMFQEPVMSSLDAQAPATGGDSALAKISGEAYERLPAVAHAVPLRSAAWRITSWRNNSD